MIHFRIKTAKCEHKGASLVEYCILISLISIVALSAINEFGAGIAASFYNSARSMEAAAGGVIECNINNPDYPNC